MNSMLSSQLNKAIATIVFFQKNMRKKIHFIVFHKNIDRIITFIVYSKGKLHGHP